MCISSGSCYTGDAESLGWIYLQAVGEVGDGQVLQDGGPVDVGQISEGGHGGYVSACAGQHKEC